MDRLKEILDNKGVTMVELAECIGIARESLYSRIKNAKISTVKEVARCLNIEPHELFTLGEDFEHIYNNKNEWKGILPKYKK